ncbi:sentrin-specific protease 8 isoform X2 [Nilaparvata lugens]|nr:sentrin-specific protease 8 isoform X2 [Nilaparvata lugens]XP_022207490.2 sentrin-specific protease 8 isoform X2 [Nilaparvata lugens]XP_022207491.2 sentrin-specific protease 8 isoform X2 [Nilaparvata lugens]
MADEIVLNYHDSILRKSDVRILEGPYWLNDTVIAFYLEYLEKEKYGETDLLLISPSVTQCLKASHEKQIPDFLDPLHAKNKSFVFMPFNDCMGFVSPGGTHWSLLVFSKSERKFYHFDSSSCSVSGMQAHELARKLESYFGLTNAQIKYMESLQQDNSYDCGIYVLCNIENIAFHILKTGTIESVQKLKKVNVSSKRHELLELINQLSQSHHDTE